MNLQQSDYENFFKVIVVGDSGVGKTNIVQTYDKGTKPYHTTPTVGIEYCSKVLQIDAAYRAKLLIWDTAGQQQFKSVTMSHYKNAAGALVVFDLTSRASFNSLNKWIYDVRERANQGVVIGIIGNKVDLVDRRAVSRDQAENFASKQSAFYTETSMNLGDTLKSTFQRLAQQVYRASKNKKLEFSRTNIDLRTQNNNSQSKCQC